MDKIGGYKMYLEDKKRFEDIITRAVVNNVKVAMTQGLDPFFSVLASIARAKGTIQSMPVNAEDGMAMLHVWIKEVEELVTIIMNKTVEIEATHDSNR